MSTVWKPSRLKNATIGVRAATYEAHPKPNDLKGLILREKHPEIFTFEAISIGDDTGQAFIVPLDESSRETAEYILRAIAAYKETTDETHMPNLQPPL